MFEAARDFDLKALMRNLANNRRTKKNVFGLYFYQPDYVFSRTSNKKYYAEGCRPEQTNSI